RCFLRRHVPLLQAWAVEIRRPYRGLTSSTNSSARARPRHADLVGWAVIGLGLLLVSMLTDIGLRLRVLNLNLREQISCCEGRICFSHRSSRRVVAPRPRAAAPLPTCWSWPTAPASAAAILPQDTTADTLRRPAPANTAPPAHPQCRPRPAGYS